jgi:hypothetical protein
MGDLVCCLLVLLVKLLLGLLTGLLASSIVEVLFKSFFAAVSLPRGTILSFFPPLAPENDGLLIDGNLLGLIAGDAAVAGVADVVPMPLFADAVASVARILRGVDFTGVMLWL